MRHPPAFQFYPADFLASSKVQRMSLAERGAYITLLCFAWQDGYIPSDLKELGRMLSAPTVVVSHVLPRVLECFVPMPSDPEHKLINERMELIRAEQLAFRSERSESGKKGMAERWKNHNSANNSAITQHITQHITSDNSSSSPSPSSSLTPLIPLPGGHSNGSKIRKHRHTERCREFGFCPEHMVK